MAYSKPFLLLSLLLVFALLISSHVSARQLSDQTGAFEESILKDVNPNKQKGGPKKPCPKYSKTGCHSGRGNPGHGHANGRGNPGHGHGVDNSQINSESDGN